MSKHTRRWLVPVLLVGALAAGTATWTLRRPSPPAQDHAASAIYQCAMHPQIVSNKPGTCPICGMRLELRDGPRPVGAADGPTDRRLPPSDAARRHVARAGQGRDGHGLHADLFRRGWAPGERRSRPCPIRALQRAPAADRRHARRGGAPPARGRDPRRRARRLRSHALPDAGRVPRGIAGAPGDRPGAISRRHIGAPTPWSPRHGSSCDRRASRRPSSRRAATRRTCSSPAAPHGYTSSCTNRRSDSSSRASGSRSPSRRCRAPPMTPRSWPSTRSSTR